MPVVSCERNNCKHNEGNFKGCAKEEIEIINQPVITAFELEVDRYVCCNYKKIKGDDDNS